MRARSVFAVAVNRRAIGGALATLLLLGLLLLGFAADSMLAMLATAAPAPSRSAVTNTGERYSVSGSHVALYNLAGEVQLFSGRGSAVEVQVDRGGPDAERLQIETGTIRNRQTLRVTYPSDRIVYREMGRGSRTTFHIDPDGTFADRSSSGLDWSRHKVTISGSGDGLDAHANLRVTVPPGQTLDVYLGVGRATVTNVDGNLRVDIANGSVASNGTRGKLVLDTGSGEIRVESAEGDVNLDTGSGEVQVSNIRGGELQIDTGSGTISGWDIQVDKLHADTGSGRIALSGVSAPVVSLDTGSGSVEVGLATDVEDLAIDTGSGDVVIRVPRSTGADVTVETGSGGIDSEIPLQLTHKSSDSLRGRLGDGRGRIYVETGSGSVRLASYTGR